MNPPHSTVAGVHRLQLRSTTAKRRRDIPGAICEEGFTMIEMMTVLVVIAILVTMLVAIMDGVRSRIEESKCMANLRSLHMAAEIHVQQKQQWPQINPKLITGDSEEYARQWIAALAPFGLGEQNWRCPTVERALERGTDKTEVEKERVDYLATPFDARQATPRRWARQPWFIERGDVHGNGNLMIFADGSISSLHRIIDKVK